MHKTDCVHEIEGGCTVILDRLFTLVEIHENAVKMPKWGLLSNGCFFLKGLSYWIRRKFFFSKSCW